jgi:hypothetical protein
MKFLKHLFLSLFIALTLGNAIAGAMAIDPVHAAGSVFFAGLIVSTIPKPSTTGALNGVAVEMWEEFIADNLFKGYEWLTRSKDRSSNVLSKAVVHIPQAGAEPEVAKNRENYPLPVVTRKDSDITYALDHFSTPAVRIPKAEDYLSYDKKESVFGDHRGALSRETARDLSHRWFPSDSDRIKRTTGTADAAHNPHDTATGTRKKFLAVDLAEGKTQLNKDTKTETGDRIAIMSENMYNQLKSDPTVTSKDTMDSLGAVWKDGDLVRLHGFDIFRPDTMPLFDNAATPAIKSVDLKLQNSFKTALAASDNEAVLLWDATKVHRALGSIEFFETLKDATYQGDVYSALVKAGGRKERSDEAGVVAIVQAAG